MAAKSPVLPSVQAQFPKSANRNVMVRAAWKHEDSQHDNPQPYGNDGWTSIIQPATYAVIKKLKDEGYTYINLETGGVAQRRKDVHISALI